MKTFLKVTFLLGAMVLVLLALPGLASSLFGGVFSGLTALVMLALGGVLILGLAVVGGGTALIVVLALLLALGCVALAMLLPVVLPVLLVVGFIALLVKLMRRTTRPNPAVVV